MVITNEGECVRSAAGESREGCYGRASVAAAGTADAAALREGGIKPAVSVLLLLLLRRRTGHGDGSRRHRRRRLPCRSGGRSVALVVVAVVVFKLFVHRCFRWMVVSSLVI